jgi:PqqD family protein of HPr-rel-A system
MAAMKPRARDDLAVVELDGEVVIYDEASGNLHHLNPSATIVFSLCDGTATIRELSEEISGVFELEPSEVERQIRSVVREFRAQDLLANPTSRRKVSAPA